MRDVVGVELWAFRKPREAERNLCVDAKDLVLLAKSYDPAYGYKVYTDEQIESATNTLIEMIGSSSFDEYQSYHLKYISLTQETRSLYSEEIAEMEKRGQK